jgi:transposase-like protein
MPHQITVQDNHSMTIADAARAIGVTAQTVRNWMLAGCPHQPGVPGRGNGATIKIQEIIEWRIAEATQDGDIEGDDGQVYNEARAKAADWHYRAIKRRADALQQLGTLIPVDHIADVVQRDYDNVRSNLNSIPGRYSVQLAAATEVHDVRAILMSALAGALSNLSEPNSIIEDADGNPEGSVYDPVDLDGIIADEADEEPQEPPQGDYERRGRRGR